jgi:hypothetical protein
MGQKPESIDSVRQTFDKEGCKLVSTTYIRSKIPVEYICNCGSATIHKITVQQFRIGGRCSECREKRVQQTNLQRYGFTHASKNPEKKEAVLRGFKKYIDEKRYTLEEAREVFSTHGCQLVSDVYIDSKAPMSVKFSCGCNGSIALSKFLVGQRCSTNACMTKKKIATNLSKFDKEWNTQTEQYKASYRATCLTKYGVDHATKAASTLLKIKETNRARFNVPYFFQTDEFKTKTKTRCQDDWGCDYYTQTDHVRNKRIATNMERFGVPVASQNPDVHAKMRNTNNERFGVPYTLMNPDIKAKADAVILERFGVRNVSQNVEIHTKRLVSLFSSKPYTFPSGRTVTVQGYEGFAIDLLLSEGIVEDEDEIEVESRKMPTYNYIGIDCAVHRYFPDIWIPTKNTIIEVKSTYTYQANLEVNLLKAQAVRDAGQIYRLMIMDPKGKLLNESELDASDLA